MSAANHRGQGGKAGYTTKENEMARPNRQASEAQPDAALIALRELGVDPAKADSELLAAGLDPEEIEREFRAMVDRAAERYEGALIEGVLALDSGDCGPRGKAIGLRCFEESVAAGRASWANGESDSHEATLSDLFGVRDWDSAFLARVSGCSMRDAGINDGDAVLVDGRARPKSGDIVLAHLVGLGQVVKRLRLVEGGGAFLDSANPDYEPIPVASWSDLVIQGVVKGRAGKL